MAGIFDFLHIKQHTAGSSNELSFDVLDHKLAEADGRSGHGKLPKPPKATQGSYLGVSGAAPVSADAEVEKRKQARRRHRLRLRAATAVIFIALAAAGVYAASVFQEQQEDFSGRINGLVERLKTVDETLVVVDGLMEDPLSAEQASQRSEILDKTPQLTSELNRVSVDAQTLSIAQLTDQEKVVVGQINEAAQARRAMLAAAQEAFLYSSDAATQVNRANAAWNDVLDADQLARDAISEANKATTQEATQQSLDKIDRAREGFTGALSELRDFSQSYGIELDDQIAYLEKKVESLDYAVETSEALLSGNRDAAQSANESYNKADAEAAKMAGDLPPSIGDLVSERYEKGVVPYQSAYTEARNRAIQTDSIIREYLAA